MKSHLGSTLDVVVGGQFGSEAKGRVTLEQIRRRMYANTERPVHSMRVGGPNAGHVVIDPTGRRWAMRQVPVGFIEPAVALYIAAGSEIDRSVLLQEIEDLEDAGYHIRERLFIHPEATVIDSQHIQREAESDLVQRLGSTAKGIGAARADRIWRVADRVIDRVAEFADLGMVESFEPRLIRAIESDANPAAVVIEGTQGYGLGMHAGYYPQCTSGNARAVDVLAQAGVGPWHLRGPDGYAVHVVIRPFPIRVAGNSGELSGETSWDQLGLEPEHTTVTQKVRRVGRFDPELVRAAVEANGPRVSRLHLSMADQVAPELAGVTTLDEVPPELLALLTQIPYRHRLASFGTGPHTCVHLMLAFH